MAGATLSPTAPDLDVLCLGEALVDLLPDRPGRLEDQDRFEVCPGGAPANVATGLARLGIRVAFRGVLGDDAFGRLLVRRLSEEGVECRFRHAREAPTGMWFVALDASGERSFFSPNGRISADKLLAPEDVDRPLLARARWLHVGSSAHVLPAGQAVLREAVRCACQMGVQVSFDPNVRAHLWEDPGALRRLCGDVFPSCALVKISVEEAATLIGESDPGRAAERLVAMGAGIACVTLGADGALLRRGADAMAVKGELVQAVDTTGAGDGFVAAMLARIAGAGPVASIPAPDLGSALRFANAVAARVCTRVGAVAGLPRAGEIQV
jgi:fructokinase